MFMKDTTFPLTRLATLIAAGQFVHCLELLKNRLSDRLPNGKSSKTVNGVNSGRRLTASVPVENFNGGGKQ